MCLVLLSPCPAESEILKYMRIGLNRLYKHKASFLFYLTFDRQTVHMVMLLLPQK